MAIHTSTDVENATSSPRPAVVQSEQLGISPSELQQTARLAGLLQTSLEIDAILAYFYESAVMRVEFDSVHFNYDPLNTHLEIGHRARHSCSYRLRLAGEFLGELTFTRKHRFAQDELQKIENMLTQLIYPMRNAIWYQRAVRAAHIDPLTGINNRSMLDNTLRREVDLAHRNKSPLSIIIADLDHFKSINDQYGHSAGDEVLKSVADVMLDSLRSSDIIFRYGGEEFVIVLNGTDRVGAKFVAERLREAVQSATISTNSATIAVTSSFGVASLSAQDDMKSLFNKADQALYKAKEEGRNKVECYTAQRAIRAAKHA